MNAIYPRCLVMTHVHFVLVFVSMAVPVLVVMGMVRVVVADRTMAVAKEFARHPIMVATVRHFRPTMRMFDDMHFCTAAELAQNVIVGTGTRTCV